MGATPGPGPIQPSSPVSGRLLVATPGLIDPNFSRTVVLIVHHDGAGSLGLVLNRPSPMDLVDPLPQWAALSAPPPVVFFGGPVAPGSAICLALSRPVTDPGPPGWRPLGGRLGILDLGSDPGAGAASIASLRVFAGHAGWGPGQLAGELASGGWVLVDAQPEDPFSDDPPQLWQAVLRRQGGDLAVLGAFPLDVSSN